MAEVISAFLGRVIPATIASGAAASGYFTGYRLSPIARTSSTLSIPKIDASTTFFRKYLGVI